MRQLLTFGLRVKGGRNCGRNMKILETFLINRPTMDFKICKRNMHRLRDIMYRGLTPNTKTFVTWSVVYRKEEPKKMKNPPPMEIEKQHGLEIMRSFDASGFNHFALCDKDFQSDEFVLVKGTFSSQPHPFNGVPPIFVSDTNLEGVPKNQYFHHYEKPRLIRKSDIVESAMGVKMLSHQDYQALLKKISST